jgi:hypothetical protein
VAGPFNYTGVSTLGYFSYADTGTGKMLVADPGGSYSMRAIDPGLAVPPPDGRWAIPEQDGATARGAPPGPPPVPEVPEVPEVPSAPEAEEAEAA